MKTQRFNLTLLTILLSGWLLVVPTSFAQTVPMVAMMASTDAVGVGQTVEVAVKVESAVDLYGFDVNIKFDPAIVEVVDVDTQAQGIQMGFGTFLDSGFQLRNVADNEAGTLQFAMTQVSPSAPKSGEGVLFVVTLRGKVVGGNPALAFEAIELGQQRGVLVESFTISAETPAINIVDQVANVLPTPLPTQDTNSAEISTGLGESTGQSTATPIPSATADPTATNEPLATATPTAIATAQATVVPTAQPTTAPTVVPTAQPTAVVTAASSDDSSTEATQSGSADSPTIEPTAEAQSDLAATADASAPASTDAPSGAESTQLSQAAEPQSVQPTATVETPASAADEAVQTANVADVSPQSDAAAIASNAQPIAGQAIEQASLVENSAENQQPALLLGLLISILILIIGILTTLYLVRQRHHSS